MASDSLPVLLEDIDTDRADFCITTETDIQRLTASIRLVGIMNHPRLLAGGEKYIPVCGYRRIRACRELGMSGIPAYIVPESDSRLDLIRMAITDNSFQRPLNLVEQSRCLALLAPFFPDAGKLAEAAAPLGLPSHPAHVEKLLALTRLPEAARQALLDESLALPAALELLSFSGPDILRMVELFATLRPGLNRQREILLLLTEIMARDGLSLDELLSEADISAILADEKMDRGRKSGELRGRLRRRRFPRLSETEKAYDAFVRELHLESGMKIIPPRYFESNIYTLEARFKSLTDLAGHQESIDRLLHHPRLAEFLK